MVNKKRFGFGKLEINFTNRSLYTLIAFFIVVTLGVGVYALQPGVPPNPGHSIQTVSPPNPCADGQFLKWTIIPATGGNGQWVCASVSGSVGGGGDFAYANWFSDSGINFPSSGDKIISIVDGNNGRKLIIQAGGAVGVTSSSFDGGELRLSSGDSSHGGSSFISLYTAKASSGSTGTDSSEKMRITGLGTVGIGTTNPNLQTKLDVNGKVKGTSFCIGTSCITSWPAGSSTTTIESGLDGTDGSDGADGSGGSGTDGASGTSGTTGGNCITTTVRRLSTTYTVPDICGGNSILPGFHECTNPSGYSTFGKAITSLCDATEGAGCTVTLGNVEMLSKDGNWNHYTTSYKNFKNYQLNVFPSSIDGSFDSNGQVAQFVNLANNLPLYWWNPYDGESLDDQYYMETDHCKFIEGNGNNYYYIRADKDSSGSTGCRLTICKN